MFTKSRTTASRTATSRTATGRTRRRVVAGLIATAAAVTTFTPGVIAADNSVLTEGKGAQGVLELGMTRRKVKRSLSAPQCGGGVETCTLATAGSGGYVQVWFEKNRVSALAFEDSASGWSTTAGVGPDSTLDDVAAAYSGETRFDRVVAVDGQGYAARLINDYNCNDRGCQVTGQHLRHFIFPAGDPYYTVNAFEGSVTYTNSSRRGGTKNLQVEIFNARGNKVGSGSFSLWVAGRASVHLDPAMFVDAQSLSQGSFSYTVSAGRRDTSTGSFDVVGENELLYLR